jgi:hypothetical protein
MGSSYPRRLFCIIILLDGETHLDERKSIPYKLKKESPDDGTETNHHGGTSSGTPAGIDTGHYWKVLQETSEDTRDQIPLKALDGDSRTSRSRSDKRRRRLCTQRGAGSPLGRRCENQSQSQSGP